MSIDTHIKFDGVEGESTHQDHTGEIELLDWAWSVSNTAGTPGGGSGVGKAEPGAVTLMKRYDKASATLAKKCAQGVHFATAVITARKAGEGQKDFLKVTMKEVFVTHIGTSAGAGGEINEAVTLSYGEIEFGYKPQDAKGGLGGEVKFGWNVKTTKIT